MSVQSAIFIRPISTSKDFPIDFSLLGYAYAVKTLIELGANINARGFQQATPIYEAAQNGKISTLWMDNVLEKINHNWIGIFIQVISKQ